MKKIFIIIFSIIITIVLFFKLYLNVVFYSKFEEVKNVPPNVAKYFSSFRLEELYGIMEENKIEIKYNPYGKNGKYELIKFKNIHPFKDIVHPQFIDDKYFVCVSGPSSGSQTSFRFGNPFVGEIPFCGWAWGDKVTFLEKVNLFTFTTPTACECTSSRVSCLSSLHISK